MHVIVISFLDFTLTKSDKLLAGLDFSFVIANLTFLEVEVNFLLPSHSFYHVCVMFIHESLQSKGKVGKGK